MSLTVVGGVLLADPEAGPVEIRIDDDRVTAIGPGGARSTAELPDVVVDAAGGRIGPGLVDLQVNGGAGVDVTAAAIAGDHGELARLERHLARHGVTAYLPTIVTGPPGDRRRALAGLAEAPPTAGGAVRLGAHLEGPCLALDHRGTHPAAWLTDPTEPDLRAALDGPGGDLVRLVTLAPELPGGLELVEELVGRGIRVAVGHTGADADTVRAAFDRGATLVTHLFNAMAPFHHRHPGPVGATLTHPTASASLLVDGHHLAPEAVRLAAATLGPERTVLVSDGTAAAGSDGSRLRLGEVDVVVGPDGAVRNRSGALAGSAVTLEQAVTRFTTESGRSLAEAVLAASANPARLLASDDHGTIRIGGRADLTVWGADDRLRHVVLGGALVDGSVR